MALLGDQTRKMLNTRRGLQIPFIIKTREACNLMWEDGVTIKVSTTTMN
jgi:hypothetical protein